MLGLLFIGFLAVLWWGSVSLMIVVRQWWANHVARMNAPDPQVEQRALMPGDDQE